ncbi:MAG: hypothetical protein KGL39_43555 [Patescibacteria group bacterium]|nr:hypothetical protein [Patescibacteria group bacterium]
MTLLSMTIRDSDVWLNFKSAGGLEASISIAALADRSGPITGRALKAWASDRIAGAPLKEFPQIFNLFAEKTDVQ